MQVNNIANGRNVRHELRTQASILGGFVAVMWVVELLDWLLWHGTLDRLGIRPRTLIGLRGILFAPFLHRGFGHLLANTVPFVVLGWLVMLRRTANFWVVVAITAVVSGLGTWLTGSARSVHVGASGLIFGFFGFLLLHGYFERRLPSIILSAIVLLFYGGLLWGALPQGMGISWQGHLFGFVGGGVAAYLLAERETADTTI